MSAFVERLAVPADDPLRLIALGLIDPVHRGPEVIARVARLSPVGLPGPDDSMAVGRAAMAVWADNLALAFLRSAVAGYRSDGRLARLAQGLMYEAWAEINCGAARNAFTGAAEAARLAEEARQLRFGRAANLAHAIAAAELREEDTAEQLIADAEAALVPMGANPQLSLIAFARGRAALATERPSEAYHHLVRIYDPADACYQPYVGGWAFADLVDAAVRGDGDLDLVRRLMSEWEEIAAATGAPHLQVQLAYAAALLADSETAEQRFHDAMDVECRGVAVLCRPGAARVRRLAASASAGRGFAYPAARGRPDLRRPRHAALRRSRAPGAARLRRAGAPSGSRGVDGVERPGAADRATGGRGSVEPRHRRAAVSLPPDGEHAPAPALPEARHHLAHPTA